MHRNRKALAAASAFGMLSGCVLFDEESSCKIGASACNGRAVQLCVVDVDAVRNGSAKNNRGRWSTQSECEDDARLGPSTCGIVQGRPSCVRTPASQGSAVDAGAVTTPNWLRVDVTRSGESFAIAAIQQLPLTSVPLAERRGAVALVSFAGTKVLDAVLLAFPDGESQRTGWVRADGATRVALITPTNAVAAEVSRPTKPEVAVKTAGLRATWQALTSEDRAPVRYSPEPPPALRLLLDSAFARVPQGPLSLVDRVVLQIEPVAYVVAEQLTPEAVRAAQQDSSPSDGGVAVPSSASPFVARVYVSSPHVLTVHLGERDLLQLAREPGALAFEVTRAVGQQYTQSAVRDSLARKAEMTLERVVDVDIESFPELLQPALTERLTPFLGAGENLLDAWSALHQKAVELGIAVPYGFVASSEEAAVRAGFAGFAGMHDAKSDLSEYLARASVLDAWSHGPCGTLQNTPLDQIDAVTALHLAKLSALRGLGILTQEQLTLCTGPLRVEGEPGIVFHPAKGEPFVFKNGFQAIYQPFFNGQVHLSWVAQRGYVSVSLQLGYRGELAPALRLSVRPGHEGKDFRREKDYGAILAVNDAPGYLNVGAEGGIATPIATTKGRLTAVAFFVSMNEPVFGEQVYPLVTASSDVCETESQRQNSEACPVWGDAP
jgi:hypothetical protein